jgi:hypothetical protein
LFTLVQEEHYNKSRKMCLGNLLDCNSTWLSLVGLLKPLEFFIPVSQGSLWQKHCAWAKPQGEDLRQYVMQYYSTNMVLLSLMLAAEINVFFGSSHELVEMRQVLGGTSYEHYTSLKFWIGLVIIMDACVTLVGLVATFTLWGMISAISDRNTHTLLRSSIGQYVTSLPPRFVVGALYLFLLWMILFMFEMISAPLHFLVVAVVLFMFFSIVIPLSAFGRLIMHTGAMAQHAILDADLEQELLPSGLHASLLIKAVERQRRNSDVTEQYRSRQQWRRRQERQGQSRGRSSPTTRLTELTIPDGSPVAQGASMIGSSRRPTSINMPESPQTASYRQRKRTDSIVSVDEVEDEEARMELLSSPNPYSIRREHGHQQHHRRLESSDFFLPRASILNSAMSRKELQSLMEMALSRTTTSILDPMMENVTPPTSSSHHQRASNDVSNTTTTATTMSDDHAAATADSGRPPLAAATAAATTSRNYHRHHRRATSSTSTRMLVEEWAEETDVRDIYGAAPPADLLLDEIILGDINPRAQDKDINEDLEGSFRWSTSKYFNRSRLSLSASVDHDTTNDGPTSTSSPRVLLASSPRTSSDNDNQSSDDLAQPLLPPDLFLFDSLDNGVLLYGEDLLPVTEEDKG